MAKVAILTGSFPVLSETFVVRHVENLFGGDTAVVARKLVKQHSILKNKPAFEFQLGFLKKNIYPVFNNILHRPYNSLLFGDRRDLELFLKSNSVKAILVEFGPLSGVISKLAKDMGLPYFIYFRGNDASSDLRSKRKIKLYRYAAKGASAVFSVSSFLIENLKKHNISLPECHVVPSGVDRNIFYPVEKDFYKIVFVGRFVEKKQPLLVVTAFSKVSRVHDKARLYMIGDGPLLEEAKILTVKLGLGDKIHFLGSLSHAEVANNLRNAQILLQCSKTDSRGSTEGLPSVIQEAMACGAIVIASHHAGAPEVIDHEKNGFLIKEGDESELVSTVNNVLANPSMAEYIGVNAEMVASVLFDKKVVLSKVENVIDKFV